ncbi:Hypothetical protein PHPALM_3117 [Phytophthora palmivora]|uniref:Uncharacterized protein n=1 Tax=Phytophthora palmivora TaxID=4796 RepID=A0A2P4YN87_9STRA|nr:Hypothetical protein PHPALM_3117 [Phytophthora palmivora]
MLAVLGPRSINEKKFTCWSPQLRALGLDWDTDLRVVSMPNEKITKALSPQLSDAHTSLSAVRISSPRLFVHLSCEILVSAHRRIASQSHRGGKIHISNDARLDLQWFQHILQHYPLRSVPLRFFDDLPEPDVHLYIDASDVGLCALRPARREFIRFKFHEAEQRLLRQRQMSINIREQLWTVLAWLCSDSWRPRNSSEMPHVPCWIDNRSAVALCNHLGSREAMAQ